MARSSLVNCSNAFAETGVTTAADLSRLQTGMAHAIGIELTTLRADLVVATMPVDERTRQEFGLLHGGASAALAETVASFGATMNIDLEKQAAVGLELNANHLRGKTTGTVTATATPLHRGRRTHVWDIRIEDEQGRTVCVARCTLAIIDREGAQEFQAGSTSAPGDSVDSTPGVVSDV